MADKEQCGNLACEHVAKWKVYWPGQKTVQCDAHASRSRVIAEAMGFDVSTEAIVEELCGECGHPVESKDCECGRYERGC